MIQQKLSIRIFSLTILLVFASQLVLAFPLIQKEQKDQGNKKTELTPITAVKKTPMSLDSLDKKTLQPMRDTLASLRQDTRKIRELTKLIDMIDSNIQFIATVLICSVILLIILGTWILLSVKKKLSQQAYLLTKINQSITELPNNIIIKNSPLGSNQNLVDFERVIDSLSNAIRGGLINIESLLYDIRDYLHPTITNENDANYSMQFQIINVKYIGEQNNKLRFVRSNISEYFYIKQNRNIWELYVVDNILNKRPSQEYEGIMSKFFEIRKTNNPNRYHLSVPAQVDWDISTGEGYWIKKGILNQV